MRGIAYSLFCKVFKRELENERSKIYNKAWNDFEETRPSASLEK